MSNHVASARRGNTYTQPLSVVASVSGIHALTRLGASDDAFHASDAG